MSPHQAPMSSCRALLSPRIEWLVFRDVSQCFKGGSWCFTMYHNVSQVFHDVLLCLVSRAMIEIYTSVTAQPPIASGIATTSQESAMTPQGLSIFPRKWSHAKLRHERRLESGVTLFLEDNFRRGTGRWTRWGRRKNQGHRPSHSGHGKWRKACINICKHSEVLKLCPCGLGG